MILKKLFFILLLISTITVAQYNNKKFSIGINGVYTTTAQIYLNPNSSDPILRNYAFEISDIFDPSIDLRYKIADEIILGLSTEYMRATSAGPNLTVFSGNSTVTIDVNDGFLLIPIELSGYYLLPFSTEKFKFLMGGGAAYYYGKHIREFGDAKVTTTGRDFAYGIQVSVSMDYLLRDNFTIHSEMKFRYPQFKLKSTYDNQNVNLNGQQIFIAQKTFDSKIDVNGVTFVLGVSLLF